MTVKEFKEIFKGDIKFFDYATGKAIGEEFKTEENEQLQELEIANLEIGTRANSTAINPKYSTYAIVFLDIDTKTLKMREAIRTIEMSRYNAWYVRDIEDNLLYTNTEYFKDNEVSVYREDIKDLPIKILNSIVTKIRTACDGHITFNIITEEEEE
jgi:hypothetical protein